MTTIREGFELLYLSNNDLDENQKKLDLKKSINYKLQSLWDNNL